jgi:hypothetical protein
MNIVISKFCIAALTVTLLSGLAFAAGGEENALAKMRRIDLPTQIKVVPWGPSEADVDAAKMSAERSAAVQNFLKGAKYRLVGLEFIESGHAANGALVPPARYRVIFYDYTNNRTIVAEGDFAGREAITAREAAFIPVPAGDEIEDAIRLVQNSPEFGAGMKSHAIRAYHAMPPYTVVNGERLVNVGIEAPGSATPNMVIGVSFKRGEIVHYANNAPPTSLSAPDACGINSAGQSSTIQGVAGQYMLTVSQGTTTLWEMLVTRPSSSSGQNGSGIEVQDVKYRGKSVLKRGHAPVLNVKYIDNACGPFLDWEYAEGFFDAPTEGATDPGPGFRVLAPGQTAQTMLENGTDQGNFQGVAVYSQNSGLGNETVLVTEMNAGWYRYIMEWRFANDGTIRPRYGFGATMSPCVCAVHYHHVYWRLDFDVVNANNRIFQVERGRKFMRQILTETPILRNYQTNRGLLIQNGSGDEAYSIFPNLTDGHFDDGDPTFGGGDFWVLKTAPNNGELGITTQSAIDMTPYLNNESVDNQDLTVWYGGHFTHSDGASLLNPDRSGLVISGPHVIGPDIRPIRW